MKQWLMGLLLSWYCGLAVAADNFPPSFTAQYKLYFKGIPAGSGIRSLTRTPDGKFVFTSTAETSGLAALFNESRIEERSVFVQDASEIRPLEYTYHQTGKKARDDRVSFDWSKKIAKSTYKGVTQEIPLEAGVLDRLLYQLSLMRELAQGKQQLHYKIVDKGEIKEYVPKFLGKESIATGLGKLETLKYQRVSAERSTTFWCAPTLHFLPAQVEHIEKGDTISMVVETVDSHH
ncbi:MAG: hypothetical protein BWK79_10200 [Beggiatoa sp. IS2]|nr:MAG: hypothetical protein BWK79_10200 [Beggiatoa sp. IS2]